MDSDRAGRNAGADRDAPRRALSKPAAFALLSKGLALRATLTNERLKEVFSYEPDTGNFVYRLHRGKRLPGDIAGSVDADGYVVVVLDYRRYKAARLAHFYMTGRWPAEEMDHIDRCRSNNRW